MLAAATGVERKTEENYIKNCGEWPYSAEGKCEYIPLNMCESGNNRLRQNIMIISVQNFYSTKWKLEPRICNRVFK